MCEGKGIIFERRERPADDDNDDDDDEYSRRRELSYTSLSVFTCVAQFMFLQRERVWFHNVDFSETCWRNKYTVSLYD